MERPLASDGLDADLPPVILFDRRRHPDRRTEWRGGRRDADWLNRPSDGLARLARHRRDAAWRRLTRVLTRLAAS